MRAAHVAMSVDPGATREAWLKASVDYYLALHPDDVRWRPEGLDAEIPSVDEIRARAAVADRAHQAIPRTGRIDPDPEVRDTWSAQVGWAQETQRAVFTEALWAAQAALQAGDRSGLEYGVRFLEADPWCFRSGYVKPTLIYPITRLELDESVRERLRRVVLAVVDDRRRRREISRYGRLAWGVGNAELRAELERRTADDDPHVRYNASKVLGTWDRIADAVPE
jgi:hypothetical protein